MARTPFSQAIHRSIQRSLHQFDKTGKIGNMPIASKTEAVQIAAQKAYNRVTTPMVKGDTGKRK